MTIQSGERYLAFLVELEVSQGPRIASASLLESRSYEIIPRIDHGEMLKINIYLLESKTALIGKFPWRSQRGVDFGFAIGSRKTTTNMQENLEGQGLVLTGQTTSNQRPNSPINGVCSAQHSIYVTKRP